VLDTTLMLATAFTLVAALVILATAFALAPALMTLGNTLTMRSFATSLMNVAS
jgi:hydrogenase-4 membrane subunit HyfE